MISTRAQLKLLAFLLLSLAGVRLAFGCSLTSLPAVDVGPDLAVFTGRVVGVLEYKHGKTPMWGIRVAVRELIQPLNGPAEEYVVLPFSLGVDCSKRPVLRDWLLKEYPPGTLVWVIGSRSELDDTGKMLETWEGSGTYMGLDSPPRPATVETVFDYRGKPDSPLVEFELRKDLLRLKRSRASRDKEDILRRLAFHPGFEGQDDLFRLLVESHLKDKKDVERLMHFYRSGKW